MDGYSEQGERAMTAVATTPETEEVATDFPSLLELFGDFHCRPDIPNAVYHADRSCVSVSGLKQILRSPAHFQAYLQGLTRKETPSMFMGTAIHARLLEPEVYAAEYVVAPEADKRTKEWKEFHYRDLPREEKQFLEMKLLRFFHHYTLLTKTRLL